MCDHDDLRPEGDLSEEKKKFDPQITVLDSKLSSLMENFMKEGVTRFIEHEFKAEVNRFHRQPRDERVARLRRVVALSLEYNKVLRHTQYCSAYALDAIGAVFEGNLKEMKSLGRMIDHNDPASAKLFSKSHLLPWEDFVNRLKGFCEEMQAREAITDTD